MPDNSIITILIIAAIAFGLVVFFVFIYFFNVWIRALFSKAHVSFGTLIGMKLRRVPPHLIVEAVIRLKKAGLMEVETSALEAHFLAGGDVLSVVNALIAADKAGIALNFQRAAAIDLAGRDVFDAVRVSVSSTAWSACRRSATGPLPSTRRRKSTHAPADNACAGTPGCGCGA